MAEAFRLTIELVPKTAWGENLRNSIKRSGWDKIRKQIYAEHDNKCGICGGGGRITCHERWEYNDLTSVQRLLGFIALCNGCDQIKHLGKTSLLAAQGKIDMNQVEAHFMRVNECDLQTFRNYAVEAGTIHKERSKHDWTLDFGEYQHLFEQYKKGEPRVYEDNDPGPSPGQHMVDTCPHCGSKGTVVFVEEQYDDDESEGWIAEYEAGLTGSAMCIKCKRGFQWQGVPY